MIDCSCGCNGVVRVVLLYIHALSSNKISLLFQGFDNNKCIKLGGGGGATSEIL